MIFGLFDQLFPLMFTVIFLIVIGTFIYTAVTGLTTWHKNNQSPRLTVPAKVVAKRQNTTHHSHPAAGDASGAHGFHSTTSTSYYVTFEVESSDRMEFAVRGQLYFVDKHKDDGASELYSISSFSTRTTDNIRKGYLLGKYGAIPDIEIEQLQD